MVEWSKSQIRPPFGSQMGYQLTLAHGRIGPPNGGMRCQFPPFDRNFKKAFLAYPLEL